MLSPRPLRLSALMQGAAETLSVDIEEGEYEALTPEQRYALRCLSMAIAGWSDRVATMEAEAAPDRRHGLDEPCLRRHLWWGLGAPTLAAAVIGLCALWLA